MNSLIIGSYHTRICHETISETIKGVTFYTRAVTVVSCDITHQCHHHCVEAHLSTSRRAWRLQRRKPTCKSRQRHTRKALFLESQGGRLEHTQIATVTHTYNARIYIQERVHDSVNAQSCGQKYMGPGDHGRASVDLAWASLKARSLNFPTSPIWSQNRAAWKRVGSTKARRLQGKAPIKDMTSPKSGTTHATRAVRHTSISRNIRRLHLHFSFELGEIRIYAHWRKKIEDPVHSQKRPEICARGDYFCSVGFWEFFTGKSQLGCEDALLKRPFAPLESQNASGSQPRPVFAPPFPPHPRQYREAASGAPAR
jgi:hypothetical protein